MKIQNVEEMRRFAEPWVAPGLAAAAHGGWRNVSWVLFDDYEILNGMMTLRHDGILHRMQNLPIGCDPCANQLRTLRYRPMESSLRPALTTTTRDKQPSASMISNHRQGLHFCGQTPASGSCCHSRRVKWGKINSLAIR